MKNIILISVLGLGLVGCGHRSDNYQDISKFKNVDATLKPYFDTFTARTGVQTAGITAGFVDSTEYAGVCVQSGPQSEVRIDNVAWNTSSEVARQQLIDHELGHCALYLAHNNACLQGDGSITNPSDASKTTCAGQPLSIMNWQMFYNFQYTVMVSHLAQYYYALTHGNGNAY